MEGDDAPRLPWWRLPVHWFWHRAGVAVVALAAFLFSLGTLAVHYLEPAIPPFQVAAVPSGVSFLLLTVIRLHLWRTAARGSESSTSISTSSTSKRTVRLLTILRALFGAGSITLVRVARSLAHGRAPLGKLPPAASSWQHAAPHLATQPPRTALAASRA